VVIVRKIVINGNSAMVTIPRTMMNWLEWRPGQHVVITLNEDRTLTVEKWVKNPSDTPKQPIPQEVLHPPVLR
jgi:antitoxin component of MazEF toxin-antitoxin module